MEVADSSDNSSLFANWFWNESSLIGSSLDQLFRHKFLQEALAAKN